MDALELMTTRRSTRTFKDQPLEREKLDKILEAGRHAPSGGNNQYTHFLVLQDKAVLNELAALVKQEFQKQEPTPGMYRSMVNTILASKKERYCFYYEAPVLIVTANRADYTNNIADCACALENMMLMANALDLGSCWINQLKWLNENEAVMPFLHRLGLEEGERPYGAVAVGYPNTESGLPNRTPLERKGNRVTIV